MNVYSELLELLSPKTPQATPGLVGTLTDYAPLTVTVRGTALTEGLMYPIGMTFDEYDVGKSVALLPWEGGFFILFFTEGGSTWKISSSASK